MQAFSSYNKGVVRRSPASKRWGCKRRGFGGGYEGESQRPSSSPELEIQNQSSN